MPLHRSLIICFAVYLNKMLVKYWRNSLCRKVLLSSTFWGILKCVSDGLVYEIVLL